MYGHKYVWLLPSSYSKDWWLDVTETNCTRSQLSETINGHFSVNVEQLPHNLSRTTVNKKVKLLHRVMELCYLYYTTP